MLLVTNGMSPGFSGSMPEVDISQLVSLQSATVADQVIMLQLQDSLSSGAVLYQSAIRRAEADELTADVTGTLGSVSQAVTSSSSMSDNE